MNFSQDLKNEGARKRRMYEYNRRTIVGIIENFSQIRLGLQVTPLPSAPSVIVQWSCRFGRSTRIKL